MPKYEIWYKAYIEVTRKIDAPSFAEALALAKKTSRSELFKLTGSTELMDVELEVYGGFDQNTKVGR